jgi:hypothetical protein
MKRNMHWLFENLFLFGRDRFSLFCPTIYKIKYKRSYIWLLQSMGIEVVSLWQSFDGNNDPLTPPFKNNNLFQFMLIMGIDGC